MKQESGQPKNTLADDRGEFLDAVTAEDIDFVSHSNAAILEQAPRGGRFILWSALLFIGFAITWSAWAELDEITRGEGKVIPSRQLQVVQNLEGGILSELRIREGDVVEKGQVLLRMDDTRFSSNLREGRLHYLSLVAKVSRLRAEANKSEFNLPKEIKSEQPELLIQEHALFESRTRELNSNLEIAGQQATQQKQELDELHAKVDQLNRSAKLLARELNMTRPLVADGAISEVEVLRLERQFSELEGDLKGARISIPKAESKLSEARSKKEEIEISFRNQARIELNEAVSELSQLSESIVALDDRVKRTAVVSPVRGTVKQLLVNTIGGVIQPGASLVEIVPLDDTLLVEARVRPADIAFLHPDQKAIVKFSAYDYAIYGGLEANVELISADTIANEKGESFYLVRVRTERSHLGTESNPLPIIPGMLGSVDILTGKKTVLSYLMKPVLRARDRALTER
ncbi:MAG: HlyD family type I secretion periplasmic adaptor subunit [Gammaproteobacteria bacterium]